MNAHKLTENCIERDLKKLIIVFPWRFSTFQISFISIPFSRKLCARPCLNSETLVTRVIFDYKSETIGSIFIFLLNYLLTYRYLLYALSSRCVSKTEQSTNLLSCTYNYFLLYLREIITNATTNDTRRRNRITVNSEKMKESYNTKYVYFLY